MTIYLGVILLALAWAAVTGSFTLPNLVFGLVLGSLTLYLVREQRGPFRSAFRPGKVLSLALLFVKELILSAWRVARLVVSSRMELQPGIFAYPLKVDRDFEITLLANLITLTPGTLSVDVSDDKRLLYVHAIDCSDPEAAIKDIETGFERKILEAFR
ncbi:Na+/H+ antiporter subunit E [Mesorhizobium sp. YR577]|uniref:Na+/H+ antiporter subunit E n=1 Tax=Mesorhizobium sp. YR577 TaxID=1884373 RepID=UPI0008E160D2|nr:Na+/H+ antiporter subunit E [Mesorhizobium sp. YR577]SFT96352.1 multicomponent Na+:H+ antiporter subunit E [Mesorhizobium sp. YR577]